MSQSLTPVASPLERPISPAERRVMIAEAERAYRIEQPPLFDKLPITVDGVFAFGVFTCLLFILQFGGLGAAGLIALSGLYVVLRRDVIFDIVWKRSFILLIPILAILSTLWSVAPGDTIRHALQYLITVGVGMMLAGSPRQKSIIQGAFLAFGVYMTITLLFGRSVMLGNQGETAFAGLNGGKNLLGDIASSSVLISFGVVLVSGRKGLLLWGPLALIFGGMSAYVLVEARSAGAIVAALAGVATFGVLSALQAVSVTLRTFFTGILLLSATTFAVFSRDIMAFAIQIAQDVFDKDPTLTGRTYLWDRAFDLIHERPVLGLGFNAFWLQGNPEAEGLWRYAGIVDRTGFNFHNTAIEILVHLGWVGLVLCVGVALICFCLLFYRYVTRPTPEMAVWCAILLYEAIRMPIEALGFLQFHFGTALIFASLGAAIAPSRLASSQAAAPQQPQYVVEPIEVPITVAPVKPRRKAAKAKTARPARVI